MFQIERVLLTLGCSDGQEVLVSRMLQDAAV